MDLKLKDKRALVTGATRGMGRAIAETLAGEGCKLSICVRDDKEVAAAVKSLQTKGKHPHHEGRQGLQEYAELAEEACL